MLYVPDLNNYECFIVYDKDTIRAYKTTPSYNSDIAYTDIFVNSHYMTKNGIQEFGRYSELPTCLSTTELTDDVFYRNDMPDILLMFLIICIFVFVIPLKIFVRLFRRFQ